jgi:SAM-dependent methyltransferase
MSDALRCPACEQGQLSVFVEAGEVPIYCNVLWPTATEALRARRGEIRLGHCADCGLVYNVAFDPALIDYGVEYENSLHGSPHFQQYADDLAERLVTRYDLRGKDVLEIGCGKGEFLSLLCEKGARRGIGFDASFDPAALGLKAAARLQVVREPYSEAHTRYTADLIYSRHVLEHIPQPLAFLRQVRAAADQRPGAKLFFEVPNAVYTLADLGIWDIIYEHCSYFSPVALVRLFERVGLRPIEIYTAYGNQFLCLVATTKALAKTAAAIPGPDLERLGITVARFAEHRRRKLKEWTSRLEGLHAEGKRVALWGAGSKGVTFLNVVPGAGRAVTAVVDLNPRKRGRYVAGTGLAVMSPEELRQRGGADIVLVMNPVYRAEIAGMLQGLGLHAETVVV